MVEYANNIIKPDFGTDLGLPRLALTLDDFEGDRLVTRYAMQSFVRDLLVDRQQLVNPQTGEISHGQMLKKQTYRVCRCNRFVVPEKSLDGESRNLEILISKEHKTAHYGNLETCSSVWICPVCGAKISARRGQELQEVIDSARAVGYQILMLTFTLQHSLGDDLGGLYAGLLDALRRFRAVRWKDFKNSWGWVGDVRTIEVTHGQNGWHPHIHMLVFIDSPLRSIELVEFSQEVSKRWFAAVHAAGFTCSIERGCWVDSTDRKIAEYVTKFGHEPSDATREAYNGGWGEVAELTMQQIKVGRYYGSTPWHLILRGMAGDFRAAELFKIYAKVTKGRRQMEWSRSPDLRKLFNVEIKSDAELADEPVDNSVFLAALGWRQWLLVLRTKKRGELLRVAEAAYEADDVGLLWEWLDALKMAYESEVSYVE